VVQHQGQDLYHLPVAPQPALQIVVAALAVLSMPLSIAAFDEYYGSTATVDPLLLARQVFMAQLLPLGLGMLARRFAAVPAAWLEPRLRRLGGVLLLVLLVLALIDIWQEVIGAGIRAATAVRLPGDALDSGPHPTSRAT